MNWWTWPDIVLPKKVICLIRPELFFLGSPSALNSFWQDPNRLWLPFNHYKSVIDELQLRVSSFCQVFIISADGVAIVFLVTFLRNVPRFGQIRSHSSSIWQCLSVLTIILGTWFYNVKCEHWVLISKLSSQISLLVRFQTHLRDKQNKQDGPDQSVKWHSFFVNETFFAFMSKQ